MITLTLTRLQCEALRLAGCDRLDGVVLERAHERYTVHVPARHRDALDFMLRDATPPNACKARPYWSLRRAIFAASVQ